MFAGPSTLSSERRKAVMTAYVKAARHGRASQALVAPLAVVRTQSCPQLHQIAFAAMYSMQDTALVS